MNNNITYAEINKQLESCENPVWAEKEDACVIISRKLGAQITIPITGREISFFTQEHLRLFEEDVLAKRLEGEKKGELFGIKWQDRKVPSNEEVEEIMQQFQKVFSKKKLTLSNPPETC